MLEEARRIARIDGLLNTLEAERYARKPMLLAASDELMAAGLTRAAQAARQLASRVDALSNEAFVAAVERVRRLAHAPRRAGRRRVSHRVLQLVRSGDTSAR